MSKNDNDIHTRNNCLLGSEDMSDPIADILRKLDIDMAEAVASGSTEGLGNYDEPAKQIRQQIGREWENKVNELLDNRHGSFLTTEDLILTLRKVCQLEES